MRRSDSQALNGPIHIRKIAVPFDRCKDVGTLLVES